MSFLTGTNCELLYASDAAGSAKNTFTAESTLNDLAGMGPQAYIPQGFFNFPGGSRRALHVVATMLISSTGTPTYTFTLRGTTTSQQQSGGTVLLGSGALTTASSISAKMVRMEGDIVFGDPAGSAATPGRGSGLLISPVGLSTTLNEVWGGAAQPGTFSTVDPMNPLYFNMNVACSASSASNQVQLVEFMVYGLN